MPGNGDHPTGAVAGRSPVLAAVLAVDVLFIVVALLCSDGAAAATAVGVVLVAIAAVAVVRSVR